MKIKSITLSILVFLFAGRSREEEHYWNVQIKAITQKERDQASTGKYRVYTEAK